MNIGIRLINFGIDSTVFLLVAFLIGFGVKDYISEDTFPQRDIRVGALIADILLFWPGTIVDFATGAIYKPEGK